MSLKTLGEFVTAILIPFLDIINTFTFCTFPRPGRENGFGGSAEGKITSIKLKRRNTREYNDGDSGVGVFFFSSPSRKLAHRFRINCSPVFDAIFFFVVQLIIFSDSSGKWANGFERSRYDPLPAPLPSVRCHLFAVRGYTRSLYISPSVALNENIIHLLISIRCSAISDAFSLCFPSRV